MKQPQDKSFASRLFPQNSLSFCQKIIIFQEHLAESIEIIRKLIFFLGFERNSQQHLSMRAVTKINDFAWSELVLIDIFNI